MSTISRRKAFERVDANDPTLAVDGLSELLPPLVEPDDPTLAVTGLEELFPEPETDDLEESVRRIEAAVTEAWELRSEIQREAVEFEHFAEQFHAFASECHHRGAA
jgi:hypothetical protein